MKVIKFKPTYLKDNGVAVIYNKSIPFDNSFNFLPEECGLISILPGAFGGNHKHPRIEAFYTPGDLNIIWIGSNGLKHEEKMSPANGDYKLFITSPFEPHVIVNKTSVNQELMEFATEPQHDVEPVKII